MPSSGAVATNFPRDISIPPAVAGAECKARVSYRRAVPGAVAGECERPFLARFAPLILMTNRCPWQPIGFFNTGHSRTVMR